MSSVASSRHGRGRSTTSNRKIASGCEPCWTCASLAGGRHQAGPTAGQGKRATGEKPLTPDSERVTRFGLSQFAIELGAALPWDVRAELQLNIQPDIADDYDPWLIDAFLRKEWGDHTDGWGLQTGLMSVPFSLEHVGPAWSPEYSISASALNSWLWEEISLAGIESEWWHDTRSGLRLGITLGAGYGPDQLGKAGGAARLDDGR